jgi:hypothetical protein
MVTAIILELIQTHGTGSFLLFHIGDIPKSPNEPEVRLSLSHPPREKSNRQMITDNLFTLCLNELPITDEGADSA